MVRNKKIVELGAGMSGLAGLAIAPIAKSVILTDGNPECVDNLKVISFPNSFRQ